MSDHPHVTWTANTACPLYGCLEVGPHEHEVCAECDTVLHGNPFCCPTCNAVASAELVAAGGDPIPSAAEAA